ncbi:hypothetical protein E4T44_13723 [Aureobasidium sp. EXF-8845]|nr:hypothetical protein E4T44_13723 [Aureobasidium sp. EXF-8845]
MAYNPLEQLPRDDRALSHADPSEYAIDLLIDPTSRETRDVTHNIAAIASSSGKDRAEAFRTKVQAPSDCACYGNYEDLSRDSNVDIVYIASPHSHHFQHAMLCLQAGKHVVCEKPITVNAAQARILYQTAKDRNLFLLDAVWTRYFPLSVQIRDIIKSGEIGEVLRVIADTSMGEDVDDLWVNQKRRKVNLDLAGGALLENDSWHLFHHLDLPELVSHTPEGRETASEQDNVTHGQVPENWN